MTANINTIPQNDDMQMHIDLAYAFIDNWLPQEYVEPTKFLLLNNASDATIRKVRSDKARARKRLDVLQALVSVAASNKKRLDEITELIK